METWKELFVTGRIGCKFDAHEQLLEVTLYGVTYRRGTSPFEIAVAYIQGDLDVGCRLTD